MVGQTLGHYRVLEKLGAGGMGEVYRAEDTTLGREVAIKVLPEAFSSDPERLARFEREAKLLASLNHPHIAQVHALEDFDGQKLLVMELVGGETLAERIAKGAVPLEKALPMALQIAQALEAAHERGIIHRDLKPANIKITPAGKPKILDFGLAKALASDADAEDRSQLPTLTQDGTETGVVLGTAPYMSPAQVRGRPVDKRADVWAFGCCLYEALTGKTAFLGDTVSDTIAKILEREPDWNALPRGTPPTIRDLLHQCLQKDEARRLHDAADARIRIEETLASGAIDRASSARWRRALGASALLVVVVAAMAARSWLGGRAAPPEGEEVVVKESQQRDPHSIAVLPFADLSPGGDQEFFSDGLAEELLNTLVQIRDLKVVGRTSSFQFKGKNEDLRSIGEKLNVAMILEGSVRKTNGQARITAQLVSASDGFHVWSKTYDVELNDIFAVQDEVATAVVRQLKINLLGGAPKAKAMNPEAYGLFLQAREVGRQATPDGWAHAVDLYQQALALEPGYAPAWDGLAANYMNQASSGLRPIAERVSLAREAVNKALALDPSFAPAHGSLGWIAVNFDGDLAAATRHYEQALVLAPANIDLLRNAATLAQYLGRLDTAMALAEYVVTQDPIDPNGYYSLGTAQYYAGLTDEAIASMRSTLRLAPGHINAQSTIGEALLAKGEPDAALVAIQKESSEIWRLICLPMAYHALGRRADSDAAVAELIRKYENDAPYNIAYVFAYRGEADRAFAWLDKAVANRDPGLLDIAVQPEFASIRNDPRWRPFLRKLGRAPEQLAAISFQVKPPR